MNDRVQQKPSIMARLNEDPLTEGDSSGANHRDSPSDANRRNHPSGANRRETINALIDDNPLSELPAFEKVMRLADHVKHLYAYWENNPKEFHQDHQTRMKRRSTLLQLPDDNNEATTEAREEDVLDLQEFEDWFQNHRPGEACPMRFPSHEELSAEVVQNPALWYKFFQYLRSSLYFAEAHISAQDRELSSKDDKIDELIEANEEMTTPAPATTATFTEAKKKKYRDEITRLREQLAAVTKERDSLRQRAENVPDEDSDEEFLNPIPRRVHFTNDRPTEAHRTVSRNLPFTADNQENRDTSPSNSLNNASSRGQSPLDVSEASYHTGAGLRTGGGSGKPPGKIDTYDGKNREKYDEWVDKLLGQLKTYDDWFVNEDRKITYLMRHLTDSPYNLLKDKYEERARLGPHNLTLQGALTDLDRAFKARDIRRNAKTELENLHMGTNETFGDFYTKFQTHINKLGYHEEDKIDELKTRLNARFANRVILGRNDTYDQLVEYCYALDSELRMYDSRRKNTADSTTRGSGKSNITGGPTTAKPHAKNTSRYNVNHATCTLGEPPKPLKDMSIDELNNYRKSLPRSATIKQRLIDERRCNRCQMTGHIGSDLECQFNRLPRSDSFKKNKDDKTSVSHVSAYDEEGKAQA